MKKPQKIALTGVEKTAILMNVLGEEKCFELMKDLRDPEVRRLLSMMGQVKKAPIEVINAVLREFLYKISEQEEIIFDGSLTRMDAVKKGLGEERAKAIFGAVKSAGIVNRKTLPVLDSVDEKVLAEYLVEEHPQTIALIVSHMEIDRQMAMIKLFPDAIRTEVLLRMANIEYVSSDLVDDLEEALREQFQVSGQDKAAQYGGVPAIADLIQNLDKKTMNSVLGRLENKDPLLTEEIRQHMFTFSDVVKIDTKGIQALIRTVPSEKLLLALKAAPEELKDKVFSVLSERAAKMMSEDLEAMGPQKVSDIESAQRDVVRIVKQLEEEGKIVIGIGEENEMVP